MKETKTVVAPMPGPWRIEGQFDAEVSVEIMSADDCQVCEIAPFQEDWSECEVATVRLIAAAPDLLEALKEIIEECARSLDCNHPGDEDECADIDDCIGCTLTQIARAAIAKAEGRSDPAPDVAPAHGTE